MTRPAAPDPSLVERAIGALDRFWDVPPDFTPDWSVGPRIDRPHSTVFPLQWTAPSGIATFAYYKVMHGAADETVDARFWRTRNGLVRTPKLEAQLADMATTDDVVVSYALAVDPDALTTITLAVPGRPFGSPWRHVATPGRLVTAQTWMTSLGRFISLIERCTDIGPYHSEESQREWRLRHLQDPIASVIGAEETSKVSRLLEQLRIELIGDLESVVFTHGDLSSTNVMVGDRLGVIDFAWIPRIRTYDLAKFAFRLEYGSPMPASWTRPLVEGLLHGYGDPSLTDGAPWKYHRLRLLCKVVAGRRPRQAWRRRRAVSELRDLISTAQ